MSWSAHNAEGRPDLQNGLYGLSGGRVLCHSRDQLTSVPAFDLDITDDEERLRIARIERFDPVGIALLMQAGIAIGTSEQVIEARIVRICIEAAWRAAIAAGLSISACSILALYLQNQCCL